MRAAGLMRQEIVAALDEGDRQRVANAFLATATLEIDGRSFSGREAILGALTAVGRGRFRASASFGPAAFEPCADGAMEWDGSYDVSLMDGPHWRGSYSLRWAWADTALKIHTLVMSSSGRTRSVRCSRQTVARQASSRFIAGLSVAGTSGAYATGPDIASTMAQRGYPEGNCTPTTSGLCIDPEGRKLASENDHAPALVSLRFRVRGPFWVGLAGTPLSSKIEARHYVDGSNWWLLQQSRFAAALAQARWSWVTGGIGAGAVRSSWRAGWGNEFEVDSSWTTITPTLFYHVTASYPATDNLLIEAHAFGFTGRAFDVPARGTAAALSAANGARWLSLGVGYAW